MYKHRGMAQLAARVAHNHKVGDSSSPPATKNRKTEASVTQCETNGGDRNRLRLVRLVRASRDGMTLSLINLPRQR